MNPQNQTDTPKVTSAANGTDAAKAISTAHATNAPSPTPDTPRATVDTGTPAPAPNPDYPALKDLSASERRDS